MKKRPIATVIGRMQASAAKWLPGLFLDDGLLEEICAGSSCES